MPATPRTAILSLLPSVITIVNRGHKPRSAELLAPGRETSTPAGGCLFPTCQFLLSTFSIHSVNHPLLQDLVSASNGSSLSCYRWHIVPLCFRDHRFDWPFQLPIREVFSADSQTSSTSSLMLCPQKDLQSPTLVTESAIIFSPCPFLQLLPKLDA